MLLSQVADRLRWSTRVEDTAVRLGADEFLVVAEDVEDLDGLRALADRLLERARRAVPRARPRDHPVGQRGAHARLGHDPRRPAAPGAERAHPGQGRRQPRPHRGPRGRARPRRVDALQLETDLKHALENEELRLFYQPIVHLADETLLGYEALVRWQHPTRGLLPPAAFLSAAEDNRLTSKLGAWVLRRACTDAAAWPEDLRVHVNISARHLAEDGFSELVAAALEESGLAPERLELEITESTALFAAEATLHSVAVVTDAGRHPGPRRLRHRLLGDHRPAPAADPHRQDRPVLRRRRRHRARHRRPRPGAAAARPRHGPAGHRRRHRGPRPGRLAARPRLRDGPGLRVRPARTAAEPGRGAHRRAHRRPGRDRRRRAACPSRSPPPSAGAALVPAELRRRDAPGASTASFADDDRRPASSRLAATPRTTGDDPATTDRSQARAGP